MNKETLDSVEQTLVDNVNRFPAEYREIVGSLVSTAVRLGAMRVEHASTVESRKLEARFKALFPG